MNSSFNSSLQIKKSTFIQYLNKENSSIPTSDDLFFKYTQIDIKNKYISTTEIQTAITNTEKLLLIRLVPSFKILSFKCYENREFKKDLRGNCNIQRAFRKFFKCYIFGFAQEFFDKEKNETLTFHIQSMSWNCFLRIVIDNFNKFYKKYLEKTIKICVDDFSQYYIDFSKVFDHTDLAELKQNVLFWLEHVLEDERNFKLLELYPELKLIIDKIYENEGDINHFKKINCYLSLIFFKLGTLTQCMKTDQNVINYDRNFFLTDSDVFKLIDLEISFLISLFAFNLFQFGKIEVMFIYKTFLKFIRIKFPLMYEYFEQNELIYGSNSIKQDYFDQIQLKKEMLSNIIIDKKTYNCEYYSIINFSNEFKDTFEEYYKNKRPQDFFNTSLTKSNDRIVDLSQAKITAFKSFNITFLKILTLELRDKILNSI